MRTDPGRHDIVIRRRRARERAEEINEQIQADAELDEDAVAAPSAALEVMLGLEELERE
jgi:hypothetical protein